jgi:branched-chain amino acid transport system substrate-binding protein
MKNFFRVNEISSVSSKLFYLRFFRKLAVNHNLLPAITIPLLAVFATSLTSYAQPKDEVRIGVLLALTGPYPLQGNAFREGIQLAEEEVNQSGGINGTRFRVFIEDTVNDPKNALTAAKKLIEQERVEAALMSSYPEYKTGGMEFERNKIPVIALWDSSPELDAMGEYIFGIGPWTPSSGAVSATFARKRLDAKSAVIINSVDPWAELVSSFFRDTFTSLGGTVVKEYQVNPGTADFRAILTNAKSKKVDVVFAPIIDHIPEFFRQKKNTGWSVPVISSDVIAQNHIAAAPEALEGVFQAKNKEPELATSDVLFRKYLSKFGRQLELQWFLTTGYDGVMMLASALQAKYSRGISTGEFLYSLKEYEGVTQRFSFTPEGSAPQMAVMYKIRGGKFVFEWQN